MFDPQDFAHRLNIALQLRNVRKMYALAVALSVDESALSRWRRGRSMSLSNLIALSRHLRISTDWLLMGMGPMDAPDHTLVLWQSEVIADLSKLDEELRKRILSLIRHLAQMP